MTRVRGDTPTGRVELRRPERGGDKKRREEESCGHDRLLSRLNKPEQRCRARPATGPGVEQRRPQAKQCAHQRLWRLRRR